MQETAPSTQLLRRVNARALLGIMRGSGVMTGTELMEATGLTRATVIAICDDLVRRGWVRELGNQRQTPEYVKGRPARRFQFDERAGHVLGVKVGVQKTTVLLADLLGTVRSKVTLPARSRQAPLADRLEVTQRAAAAALEECRVAPQSVLAVSLGVAAPVSRDGEVLTAQKFWKSFDIDVRALSEMHGWPVLIENDANLAALAERWQGAAQGVDDVVVLLAGERLGAGVVESGRLLHGNAGAVGEMGYLSSLDGVGDSHGIAHMARAWGRAALGSSEPTSLTDLCGGRPERLTAAMVFAAAAAGDRVAGDILGRLAMRMARVIGSLSTMLNPALVVLGGAVAESATAIIPEIEALLPAFTSAPPRVAASPLGDASVSLGAIRRALDYVDEHALDLRLTATVWARLSGPTAPPLQGMAP